MRVTAAAATDVGLVREGNEDSYLTEGPLFAVADGMGGHRGGEVASQLAVETLEKLFKEGAGDLPDQVQEANRVVFERSVLDRKVAGMGTTLTAALVEGDRVRLAHVGDSRAYLLRDGTLRLLTEDHTLVHRMVSEGEISKEEAETHPQRSVLTRALGVDTVVDVDDDSLQVRPGDRLLLCTDGLTSMVSEDEIEEVLRTVPDPQEAAQRLVRRANEAGGVDNTTVVILDFSDDAAAGRPDGQAPPSREAIAPARVGRPARSRRLPTRRLLLWVGIIVAVVVVALVGLRLYLDSQWYVGVSDGHVAIFRGIPTEVAGFDLHHVVVETTISAEKAESLAVYGELGDGITADDRERASAIVEQIRLDVEQMQQIPKPNQPNSTSTSGP
ncbi:MAG: Stp1/IreP family PP2C-type Ser/Thr phosphatase [Actinobacteria bacterium]|nr:MAG: Stp1/IreP family PP2C-type Ser/Thr phosphatase [Actinomycetota bacterium]